MHMHRFAVFVLCGFTATLAAQQPGPVFDVASIKRNIDPKPLRSGTMPNTPKGEIRLVAVAARVLVLRAYPAATVGAEVVGLPSWATSERYDVTVKGNPDATPDEVRQMWQTLLAERMKLAVRYEPREVRAYKLVIARADGKLGPQLKPSTLECPAPDATKPLPVPSQAARDATKPGTVITADTERLLMSQCLSTMTAGNTTYAGAVPMSGLVAALRLGVREPHLQSSPRFRSSWV